MRTLGQILGTSNRDIFEDDVLDLREGQARDFMRSDHRLRVTATRHLGVDTGRRRYRVECLTCGEIVHEATTGAHWNMEFHVRDAARRAAEESEP
jgi:hypothetical protein